MYIYIIVFIISLICCRIVEKNEKKKGVKILFSLFAVLIPSILAGVRSTVIGTDINVYVLRLFNYAQTSSLTSFFSYSDVEIGYSLLTYLLAKVSNNVGWLLFIDEFIIIGFIYLFAYNKRKEHPIWLIMAVYYFLAYNKSLNIIRQSMSISVIIYSLIYMERKNYKKVLILFLLALSFHTTSLFAIPVYIIMYIYKNDYFKKSRNIILLTILIVLVILAFCYEPIIHFLTYDLKIISDKYYGYFTAYVQEININYFELIYKLIWVFCFGMIYIMDKNKVKNEGIYFIFLLIDLILFPISFKISNADRIGYYYLYPAMLIIVPTVKKMFKKDHVNQRFVTILILILLFSYWYRIYINLGFCETYPYKSDILTFLNF